MNKLNMAIIGYGGMGSYHATVLLPAESERYHVYGIFDLNPDQMKRGEGDGYRCFATLEELLADEAVDVVLIATPNDSHKELAILAMQAGKHVLCEKPVAMNTKELDEILQVAKETNQIFMVHQNRRWDPDFLRIKALYEQETIGELFQLESRVQGANGIPGDWRHLPEHGGGMLLDWGVHLLDQLLWLVKRPIRRLWVDFSYVLGDQVDDGFVTFLEFDNGVKAIVEVGTSNYAKLPRWYVKGYQGTACIDDWDLSGQVVRATTNVVASPKPIQAGVGLTKTMAPPSEEATERIQFVEPSSSGPSLYQNLYEVIREGAEPIVKNEEVRTVLALIDEMFVLGKA